MSALLAAALDIPSSDTSCNFYNESSDIRNPFLTTAVQRRASLLSHINRVRGGDVVLVGEAAGWRGARQSGVPFTSSVDVGLPGPREASATIVRRSLRDLRLDSRTLLWNAFPSHPHLLGNPSSNRTPSRPELIAASAALDVAVSGRRVVCVGRSAAYAVERILGLDVASVDVASATDRAIVIRHPSFGGAPEFRAGLLAAAMLWGHTV